MFTVAVKPSAVVIVTVAVRDAPVLPAADTSNVPLPVPDALLNVAHAWLAAAVHVAPAGNPAIVIVFAILF
jgi:hypothetical protein